MENTDPRLGKSSASSFGLDALCPGRRALLDTIGDFQEPFDEDADRGTRLHEAWEREMSVGLEGEDVDLYNEGLKLVDKALDSWQAHFGPGLLAVQGPAEYRFWFHDQNGELAASGQADRHWIIESARAGLVLDFKALWCKSLVPSELNWQLLFLAVCAAREYDLEHVRCAFAKPMFRQLDIVDYNANDLQRAEYAIEQVLWASKRFPERRSGPHCRHCKAVTACPEAKAYCLLPSVKTSSLERITPTKAGQIVDHLDLLDCAKIFETQTSRRNIEDAIKERLKSLSPEILAGLGLKLGKARVNRTITDPKSAFELLILAGVPVDKLWSAVKFGNEKLAEVVQESLHTTSNDAAVEWVRTKLKPFIEEKDQDKPLEKLK